MASVQTTARRPVAVDVIVDQRARLEAAFDRHGEALYRYLVVRTGGDRHLADDLMQQVWLQLNGAADRAKPIPEDELEFWLRGIARNVVRAHWRQVQKRPEAMPIPEPALAAELADRIGSDELPVRMLERREIRDQLVLALTRLPTADQELIVGRYFQGRSHDDLAAEIDISARAVEGRLYRARRTLLEVLRDLGA
ncbi:MAG: sigma-70 family RNA polymerase sigma factor [bacterium]|nr:sigma-70 family RNA polymerase sigma factor [bacterium]